MTNERITFCPSCGTASPSNPGEIQRHYPNCTRPAGTGQ